LIFYQCAKLLLAVSPATIPEDDFWQYLPRDSAKLIALREGARLQPLVATARLVRAIAFSLIVL